MLCSTGDLEFDQPAILNWDFYLPNETIVLESCYVVNWSHLQNFTKLTPSKTYLATIRLGLKKHFTAFQRKLSLSALGIASKVHNNF